MFGTASGFRQDTFEWHRLFKLAGLSLGRDKGVVWHSLRHEFCSRTAENTGDPVVAQELARHKDLRTTQGYLHARRARVLAGAVSLDRSRRPAPDSIVGGSTGAASTVTIETIRSVLRPLATESPGRSDNGQRIGSAQGTSRPRQRRAPRAKP